jgi:hypothetical protein
MATKTIYMPKYHLNTMKFDELHAIWVNKLVLHHGLHGLHGPFRGAFSARKRML